MLRKYILLISVVSLLFSCKKDDESTPTSDNTNTSTEIIGAVPSSFTQKVLLETFTGAGQPQCTDGFVKMEAVTDIHPATAIPVNIHYSDAMEIPYYTSLEANFNNSTPPTFPSAMINRLSSIGVVIFNRTQWMSNYNTAAGKTAKCGLALNTSVSGSTATVELHAGFNQQLTGNYYLTVFLIENNVSGNGNQFDQRNSYNTTNGHEYYNSGDPIVNFQHQNVLRKMLSADMGDIISTSNITAGGEFIKNYTVNISSYKVNDLYIVAAINKIGSNSTTHEIMNVQRVKLGNTQNWD